jgi:hypothetical protein
LNFLLFWWLIVDSCLAHPGSEGGEGPVLKILHKVSIKLKFMRVLNFKNVGKYIIEKREDAGDFPPEQRSF